MTTARNVLATLALAAALSVAGSPAVDAGKAADVRREAFEALNRGVTAYKNGDFERAVELLQQSAGVALNSFRAHYYLGLALIGDRRYSDAIDVLNVALDLDPSHLQSLAAFGDAHLKLGDLGEARAGYFRALKLRPEYAPALDGLARVYESEANDATAIEHFLRAIRSNRGYAPAYTHLGDLYLRLDRFSEAVQLLEEAIAVRPDFAAGMNRLALAYGRLGFSNEAIATISRAMVLEPRSADHRATLGRLHLERGSLTAAEQGFHAALELDDANPEALRGLAELQRRRGDYDDALAQIDLALADERLDAALALRFRRDRESILVEQQAVLALARRIEEGEATSQDHSRFAQILAGREQWAAAAEQQALAEPGPTRDERLAYLYFRAHRFRDAHKIYAALAAAEARAEFELNDGVSLAMLGDDAGAVAAYRRALAIDPRLDAATLYLGNALLRLGEHDAAVTAYRDYLRAATGGERAERVRRILASIAPDAIPQSASPLDAVPAADESPEGA